MTRARKRQGNKKSRQIRGTQKNHKKLAKKVKKAFKRGKCNLGESWVYYKKIARKYKALCRKSRVSSWRKYKETRQTVNDIVKLMNIIQKKKQTNINTFTKDNGETTDPGEETLDALINAHFPNAVEKIRKKYNSSNCLVNLRYKRQTKNGSITHLRRKPSCPLVTKKQPDRMKSNLSYSTICPTTLSDT